MAGKMSGIGETIDKLNEYRRLWLDAWPGSVLEPDHAPEALAGLKEIVDFGPNPGKLRMLAYAPVRPVRSPPLVVVLHGCRQTAEGYDLGSGWSQLAARAGFVVCLPEQRGGNNAHHCFNWFTERDTARGGGEAGSIHAMVEHLVETQGVDRQRIFVTGLSAGGAMAAAMLAAYPDVFAAGAVIAGLPYRAAVSVGGALEVMAHGDRRSGRESAAAVRAASDHAGPWPRLSVWHGTADETVARANAGALVRQWRNLTGLRASPSRQDIVDGQIRRVWLDASGSEFIEEYELEDFGHGAPLDAARLGQAGPFLLEAGISSTLRISEFFGLIPKRCGIVGASMPAAAL